METAVLAAPMELGDWVKDAVILAIIGLSALSGVGKAIAKKINAKRQAGAEKGGPLVPPRPPAIRGRGGQLPPVARPMPPRRRIRPAAERSSPSGRRPDAPMASPLAKPVLELRPEPADVLRAPEPPPVSRRLVDQPRGGSLRKRHVEVHVQPKAPTRRTVIRNRQERKALGVEQRLGHVQEGVVLPDEDDQATPRRRLAGRFSNTTLRQAVVWSEILAPPLSLRPPDLARG